MAERTAWLEAARQPALGGLGVGGSGLLKGRLLSWLAMEVALEVGTVLSGWVSSRCPSPSAALLCALGPGMTHSCILLVGGEEGEAAGELRGTLRLYPTDPSL